MQTKFFERFGKYVFLEPLGRGGMAEVYLAIAPGAQGVNKFYAVKKIVSENLNQSSYVEMFKEEAQIAVQLQHSNIVSVHDFGFENGQFFLVMEYVQGKNLANFLKLLKLKRKILPLSLVALIMREITAGLEYAHSAVALGTGQPLNIVHRDINPQNIMVSLTGDIKIIDFGVAKAMDPLLKQGIRSSGLVGKINYMSPEIVNGKELDSRSDQFSLGAVFWELITRTKLFEGESEEQVLEKIKQNRIPLMKRQNPFVTDALEDIVLRCLRADPKDRYQKTSDLLKAINFFVNQNYPEVTKANLQSFFAELVDEEMKASQERLRGYYNMHFDEAGGDTALAVSKAALAAGDLKPKSSLGQGSEPQAQFQPQASVTQSLHSENSLPSANPSPDSQSQPPLNKAVGVGDIKPVHRPQVRQDQVPFSKALYLSTQYTERSYQNQNEKMKFIYVIFLVGFILSTLAYIQSHSQGDILSTLSSHAPQPLTPTTANTPPSVVPDPPPAVPLPLEGKQVEISPVLPAPQGKNTSGTIEDIGCLIDLQGALSCWGRNEKGQLGLGFTSVRESSRKVSGNFRFERVSVGTTHSCGITSLQYGGKSRRPLKCWGDNSFKQIGDPTLLEAFTSIPVPVDPSVDYAEVAVGKNHTCALTLAGKIKCWGRNDYGQLGLGHMSPGTAAGADSGEPGAGPALVLSNAIFVALATGDHHTCGLTQVGIIECWGKNDFGQLGLGHAEPTATPTRVVSEHVFSQINIGPAHTCARDRANNLWCWGRNEQSHLIPGLGALVLVPSLVGGGTSK